jgi:protein subunit release factor A
METILLELQAGEGGDDAKLLVQDQLSVYLKAAAKHGL